MPDLSPDQAIQALRGLPEARQRAILGKLSPQVKQGIMAKLSAGASRTDAAPPPSAPKPEERTVGNYADEITRGVGRGVMDDVTGIAQTVMHPIDTVTGLAKQAKTSVSEAGKEFRDTAGAPLGQRLGAAALTGLENAPMIGGMVQHAEEGGEEMGSPEAAGAAAEGITAFAAPEIAGKAIGVASKAADLPGKVARGVTGTGVKTVRDLVKQTRALNEEKITNYANALKEGRTGGVTGDPLKSGTVSYVKKGGQVDYDATRSSLPPVEKGHVRLFRSESPTEKFGDVFDAKKLNQPNRPPGQSYTDDLGYADYYKQSYGKNASTEYVDVPRDVVEASKSGPGEYVLNPSARFPDTYKGPGESSPAAKKIAYDRGIKRLDAKIKEDLQATEKQVNAEGNKKYADLRKVLKDQEAGPHQSLDEEGHVSGEPVPLVQHLYETANAPLRGSETEPAIIKSLGNRLNHGDVDLTYNDLQGYREELGRELRKGSLPPDVFTAYKNTFSAVDDAMQKIADRNGLGKQQAAARNYWRQYAQTFLDRGSPIRKALDAKERGQTVDAFRGADQSGVQALARFNPDLAQQINTVRGYAAKADQAKGAEPKAPVRPTDFKRIGPEDIQAAKARGLEQATNTGTRRGMWAAAVPVLGALRGIWTGSVPNPLAVGVETGGVAATVALISRAMRSPKVVEFLSKATPQDVAQIPPEMRGDFPRILTEAKKRGIRVSPALVRAFTGAAATGKYDVETGTGQGASPNP